MAFPLGDMRSYAALPFDAVIDVRAPSEFAEDHLPNAINLPVLSDAERAEVGTLYKQDSPFRARKVGAALVARNAAHHIETALADKPGSWKPLVYCWRGGQRSGSFATILQQIGWRAEVVEGGYQSYRRQVAKAFYDQPLAHRLLILDGNTGTAKTEILARVAAHGGQVIDLEAMAEHRGSVLGGFDAEQPSQKMFESRLIGALSLLDPARPVFVEAESNKIGALGVPPSLWTAMRSAPRVLIRAEQSARASYLARTYTDIATDSERLGVALDGLILFQGLKKVERWKKLASDGAFELLASELIADHYDGAYARARSSKPAPVAAFDISLDSAGLDRAASQILQCSNAYGV